MKVVAFIEPPQGDVIEPSLVLNNGNRTIVSGNGVGGATFGSLTYGIAVYPAPVPEPASAMFFSWAPAVCCSLNAVNE
jgi:hypothetical protein